MTWWWRTRGLTSTSISMIVGMLVAATGLTLRIPAVPVWPSGVAVPVTFVLPLATAVLLARGLAGRVGDREDTGTRRVGLLDRVALVLLATGFAAMGVVLHQLTGRDELFAAARNGVGFLALTVIAGRVLPPSATAVPATALIIAASLLGGAAGGGTAWWAWPVADPGSPGAITMVVVTLTVGIMLGPGRQDGVGPYVP